MSLTARVSSSLVIDRLCDQAQDKDLPISWLYCDYNVQQKQTVINIIGAIVKQLVGRGGIPKDIRDAFLAAKKVGGRRPLLADLMRMLRIAIGSLPQVFVCIDALDECQPKDLPHLLESLRGIVRESPGMRIFLTGRPHIGDMIHRYFTKPVTIPITPNEDDIRSYVNMKLDRDEVPEAMDNGLREEIVRIIVDKMSNMYVVVSGPSMMYTYQRLCRFLLASLNIEAILGEVTIGQRRKKLKEMARGNGLSDAYTATLTRVKAQKGNKSVLGQRSLIWVSHSKRPLRAEELCHALGVEIGSTDLDPDSIPSIRTLLSSCLGLLTLEASSSTVRLVHFTLQEHLSNDPTQFHCSHSTIAEICLTYLNFGSVRDLSPTLGSAPSTMPLLKYASIYWGEHTRNGMTENVKILALRLLARFNEHISAQLLLLEYVKYRWDGPRFNEGEGPLGFTGLHGMAYLGIVEVAASVLEMEEWDINASDCTGSTALIWAAYKGCEEIVKMVLEHMDVNPDQADKYGRTALSWAAGGGHDGIVKMLLERKDVSPDRADTEYGQTPLSWAASSGHEGIVTMLLQRKDVNPDQADTQYGRTPLSWAAEGGHEGIVKILLEREGVNPDQGDTKYGRTPLWWAAQKGHDGIVKILLQRKGVNPGHADSNCGRTPLWWAAQNGDEGIVKMLLERGEVNPDQPDTKYGRAPLWWAAQNGHSGIVKMLLQREDVSPDRADIEYGLTPLLCAAGSGHEEIVNMFLERENVNPDWRDTKYGLTPLLWAAESGYGGIVKMLLERGDVNPNNADTKYGRTPLSWAAEHGYEEILKMLLERANVNPNQADTEFGRTPLWWAAKNGHEGIVKVLLQRECVNPDHADTNCGQTPLWWAAKNGDEGIVMILLEREGVSPDKADTRYGQTPLSWAAVNGHEGIVKMLMKRKDVYAIIPDNTNQTLHPPALSEEHNAAVNIPQERGNVNWAAADRGSPISLTPSSVTRDECVVGMQLRSHDSNIDVTDSDGPPEPLPAAHHHQPRLLDLGDSIPSPADSSPLTQSPRWPLSLSTWTSELWYLARKTDAHPNTQSILSFTVKRSFIIASLVCPFAFLLYLFPPPSLDIFSLRKYLPGEGLV